MHTNDLRYTFAYVTFSLLMYICAQLYSAGFTSLLQKRNITGVRDFAFIHTLHYDFIINNPNTCGSGHFLLVAVMSAPGNLRERNAFRKTWSSVTWYNGQRIRTVFVLGKRSDNIGVQRAVYEENQRYRDIIQLNFSDYYRNLTLKTVLTLRWVITHCRDVKFVMKTDDDMIVQYKPIVGLLTHLSYTQNYLLYIGHIFRRVPPIRNRKHKWHVTHKEFSGNLFPDYASGTGYILSMSTVDSIHQVSFNVPMISMEDVYIGVCARKLGVTPNHYSAFKANYYVRKGKSNICGLFRNYTIHLAPLNMRRMFWKFVSVNDSNKMKICEKYMHGEKQNFRPISNTK